MIPTQSVCAALLGGCFMAMTAHAELRVLLSNGQPPEEGEAEVVYDAGVGGYRITLHELYAPGDWSRYTIIGDGGEVIEEIIIDVPCWEDANGDCIPAGSPVDVQIVSAGANGIRTVRNVIQTGTAETIISDLEVREDVGRVEAEVIGRVIAGRDVIGPVISTTPDNPDRGITRVWADRNILGDVKAEHGEIGLVYAVGTVGSPDQPVDIRAKHTIWQVTGEQGIYADINTRANGGSGGLSALTGDRFNGRIETQALIQNPWNGLLGGIRFWTEFSGEIVIGSSYVNAWGIELPPNGLGGQITFNADGDGDGNGAWTSLVHVGPIGDPTTPVLDGPAYPQKAIDLGGGSIGLVPFSLHDSSCSPQNGGVLQIEQGRAADGLRLRHYGPLKLAGPNVVELTRRLKDSDDPFVPFSTVAINLTIDDEDPNSLVLGAAGLAAVVDEEYEYQIETGPDLRCDVAQSPAVKWTAPYRFTIEFVEPQCPADLNDDGSVDSSDLFELLGSWGTGGVLADLNGSGGVDSDDLFILLGEWGACPSERAGEDGDAQLDSATSSETANPGKAKRTPARQLKR